MSGVLAGLGFFGVLVGFSALIGRRAGVSPRVAAGAHLVSLMGWATVPLLWLACLGTGAGSLVGGAGGGGCLLGLDRGTWQLLGLVPSAALGVVLLWHGVRHAVVAQRAARWGVALARSVRRPTSAGEVWVVPADEPIAVATGIMRCRAVVSRGLLAPLSEREQEAVCEHEAAHVRLGHPRLLVVGGAVAAAYRWLPPVRWAWDGLCRELEAAADDEAAKVVGRRAVLSALLQVALVQGGQHPGRPWGDFAATEHLRWRIARLEHPSSGQAWPTRLVGSAAVATGSAMALVACAVAGRPLTVLGLSACLGLVAVVGLRPTWAWGRRSTPG